MYQMQGKSIDRSLHEGVTKELFPMTPVTDAELSADSPKWLHEGWKATVTDMTKSPLLSLTDDDGQVVQLEDENNITEKAVAFTLGDGTSETYAAMSNIFWQCLGEEGTRRCHSLGTCSILHRSRGNYTSHHCKCVC